MSYVVKISPGKLGSSAYIYKKYWSEDVMSNVVELIIDKDFIFEFRAKRWSQKKLIEILQEKKEVEFIYGRG